MKYTIQRLNDHTFRSYAAGVFALALLLVPSVVWAQIEGTFTEVEAPYHLEYESTLHAGSTIHGVVTDDEGKIWVSQFGSGQGIAVYNEDGTQADFSPIESVNIDGTDYPTTSGGRGVTVDNDGNILAITNSTQLLHIDAETGEGIAVYEGAGSLAAPAVDSEGFAYTAGVGSTPPVFVLDIQQGLNEVQQINPPEAPAHLTRSVEVADGGATVYSGEIGTSGDAYIWKYTTEDFSSYELADSIGVESDTSGFFDGDISSITWGPTGPTGGMLWATDEGDFPQNEEFTTRNIKVLNVNTETYFTLTSDSLDLEPRGVAFAGTEAAPVAPGDTVYVGSFFSGLVEKFSVAEGPPPTDIEEQPSTEQRFALSPSYPNPFSRQTTIRYKLERPTTVTLRIYDALGREVKTPVANQPKSADTHTVHWDGTNASGNAVSSGVYFYTLEADGQRQTKSVTVVR